MPDGASRRPVMPGSLSAHFRLVAVGLCLLLAGCFTSSQPKFPLTGAAAALGDGGRFTMYERDKGQFVRGDTIEVKRRPDGAYDFIDKDETTTASLHAIGPNRYIAQAIGKPGARAEYAVVQVRGNEVLAFAPDCRKQDAAKLTALGVVIGKYSCSIDRVADPAALFASLVLGEPTSKLVRE
jgi:hypothetical protein